MRDHPKDAETAHQEASISSQRQESLPIVREARALPDHIHTSNPGSGAPKTDHGGKEELHPVTKKDDEGHQTAPFQEPHTNPSRANPAMLFRGLGSRARRQSTSPTTLARDDTPLVLTVEEKKVSIDTQIQLYATNAQLCHPFVSPVVGYLGGLCPLYICCGANEVLRDEIIYA